MTWMKRISRILTFLTTISIACGSIIFNRRHVISKAFVKDFSKSLTVIIPARDEAERIGKLLQSLQKQTYPHEIIVMDDGSTDQTVDIAKHYGATVYSVEEDSSGEWFGKSRACYQGANYAQTELLTFIDADVDLPYKDSLEQVIQQYHQQQSRGLLSVQPFHRTETYVESLSAIFNLLTVVGMNQFSSLTDKQLSNQAFGPMTVTNKQDYVMTNGHQCAKHQIIEGFALGHAFAKHHLPVNLYEGKPFIQFRMYQQGFSSLLQGWTKHFSSGASQTNPKLMLAIVIWLVGSMTSFTALCLGVVSRKVSLTKMLFVYSIYTYQFIKIHNRVGKFSLLLMMCHPLLFIFFVAVFLLSWKKTHVSTAVEWKGRQYKI